MALAPLATTDDLSARGIDISDADRTAALLASASDAVRSAAGCTITSTEATISVGSPDGFWLPVPGWAVRSVADVDIDGTSVTDWRLISGRLWRAAGWRVDCGPSLVTLTYTQGLTETPADIVDLVCSLVAAGMSSAEDGYDPHRGVSSERLDDYQVSFTRGEDEVVSVMELPQRTRAWLASRFAGGAAVTGTYR